MPRKIRSQQQFDGDREAAILAGTLGRDVKRTRKRRRLTQRELAAGIGLEQSRVSEIELGEGMTLPLGTWVRLGMVLGRPFAADFSRDVEPEPRDSGHLAAQELVLAFARRHGRTGTFELPTRPSDQSRSTDVGLRDDRYRCLIRVEIWDRLDDLGRAVRDTDRKDAEALIHAAAADRPYRLASCWLLVDTSANRALVGRYPEILRARFTASSAVWVRTLTSGGPPPDGPGICWIDPRAGRITALRQSRRRG